MIRTYCDRCGKMLGPFESSHAAMPRKDGVMYLIFEDYHFCRSCKKEAATMYNVFNEIVGEWIEKGRDQSGEGMD